MPRDILAELKQLRLFGMAQAWDEFTDQDNSLEFRSAAGLMTHLLQAEDNDRHIRSTRYQRNAARFPIIETWPGSTSAYPRSMRP
jgi:hypothetical protein